MIQIINRINKAARLVFEDSLYKYLAISLGANLLALDYFIFSKTTTFEVFFASNGSFYNLFSILLTLAGSALFGIALAMVFFIARHGLTGAMSNTGQSFLGAGLGVVASGCPVCGAWFLPLLGIAGSLAAFPLQGLEIKFLAVLLLGFSINESAKSILGICEIGKQRVLKPIVLVVGVLLLVYVLPKLPPQFKLNFAKETSSVAARQNSAQVSQGKIEAAELFAQVNPAQGYTIKARYGNLGPQILASGALDLEKLQKIYEQSGTPLTDEQLTILTKGLDKEITITQDNSYFLINFFWALGLANKNSLLEEGPIAQYGQGQIGSFASTGGWSIAKKDLMDFYSKTEIIKLTPAQQANVEEVAQNTYRPCCGNPTSFPDCNHGMALLAVLELMAAQDASIDEMFKAAKYFNAFWFPQNYLDLATYFKAKEGKDFKDVDAKTLVSAEFSSGQGWSKTKQWLSQNNLVEEAPSGGGGCGV